MCALPFGQFCIHVQGVMFCLDGLFVSQSNDMPPDPLLCFAIVRRTTGLPPGPCAKECDC